MENGIVPLAGETLIARPSGALHWPARATLVVGDLHLGRSARLARRGASLLPPYETAETLDRLAREIAALAPARVICLGDSFDDSAASAALDPRDQDRIEDLASGRDWIWITGNHDPAPTGQPGRVMADLTLGTLAFRHIARAAPPPPGTGEVSAHYHPKARVTLRGRRIARSCFLAGGQRVLIPAFGTFTGGLDAADAAFDPLFGADAAALLTGRRITTVPRARLLAGERA